MAITLTNNKTGEGLALPPELFWEDEFGFQRVKSSNTRAISGAFLVVQSIARGGKPVTLSAPDDMNWISRKDLRTLFNWADDIGLKMTIKLTYGEDVKEFLVVFNHAETPIVATPVLTYASPKDTDDFHVTLNLLEVVE